MAATLITGFLVLNVDFTTSQATTESPYDCRIWPYFGQDVNGKGPYIFPVKGQNALYIQFCPFWFRGGVETSLGCKCAENTCNYWAQQADLCDFTEGHGIRVNELVCNRNQADQMPICLLCAPQGGGGVSSTGVTYDASRAAVGLPPYLYNGRYYYWCPCGKIEEHKYPGDNCVYPSDCPTENCMGGKCQCSERGEPCSIDEDCCGDNLICEYYCDNNMCYQPRCFWKADLDRNGKINIYDVMLIAKVYGNSIL